MANPNYALMADNIATRTAQQYGLDPAYFKAMFHAQIKQESGFNPNARSPAGAQGIAQIVPKWHPGVNTSNPQQSLAYAARMDAQNYKKYGNYRDTLSVYNSGRPWSVGKGFGETNHYVNSILGAAGRPGAGLSMGMAKASGMGQATATASMMGQRQQLLSFLLGNANQAVGNKIPDPVWYPPTTGPGGGLGPLRPASQTPLGGPVSLSKGRVLVSPGANRPGVKLNPRVQNFVGMIAGAYGSPLTIGTGTNHNQFVAGEPGVQSEHWTGNAADIPMSGSALTRLGQDALITAGMNPAKARKQKGGVYNLNTRYGRVQIIFNSHVGGNHFNHLHVGIHH